MVGFKRKFIYGSITLIVFILVTGSLVYAKDSNDKQVKSSVLLNDNPVYQEVHTEIGESQFTQQTQTTTQSNIRSAYSYNTLNQLEKIVYTDGQRMTYTYDSNGNQLTMNVDTAPGQTLTIDRTAYGPPSFPSTIEYHQGGLFGTLYPIVLQLISGTYTPSASYTATDQCYRTIIYNYNAQGQSSITVFGSCPSSIYFSSGGYTGTLFQTQTIVQGGCPSSGPPNSSCTQQVISLYSGSVFRPEVDTRVWRQEYSGTVYQI